MVDRSGSDLSPKIGVSKFGNIIKQRIIIKTYHDIATEFMSNTAQFLVDTYFSSNNSQYVMYISHAAY